MKKQIFNSEIDMNEYLCSSDENHNVLRVNPSLRLYIKVTDDCNAKCDFCANNLSRDFGSLDFAKLGIVIRYLYDRNLLHGVSLTGGEPMLYPDIVNKIINLVYSIDPHIEVQLSTNGINFRRLLDFENINNLESIHLSRHHYDEKVNQRIFHSSKVASDNDIIYVQDHLEDKKIININTLVMKGYIDSLKEIKAMLNYVGRVGVYKNGFVSLMKCNEFSKERFINFNDIFRHLDKDFFLSHHFYSKTYCECIDGVYLTDDAKIVEFYARMVKECNQCESKTMQLVYTTNNRVLNGFGGKEIF